MITCPWSVVITVLCVGTLVRIGAPETHNKGVHYKPKHLQSARGTLVYPEQTRQDEVTFTDPDRKEIIARPVAENYHVPRSFMLAIRPVPVDVYREAMTHARTHYDVFRIFLPLDLSDAEIDRMIWSTNAMSDVLTIIQGSGMPRFTPGIHPAPSTHTTALVPVRNYKPPISIATHDVMMSDGPACGMCQRILGGATVVGISSPSGSRRGQLQAESWHRRRRRHKPSGENGRRKGAKHCKKRRRALAANIKRCRQNGNQRRCRTLRDRYKRLRQKCKRDSENQSIIPGSAASLPDPRRPKNRPSRPDPGEPVSDKDQWKQWEKTKSETDEHGRCGKPVPQVVRVREILARGDEEYFPSCVLRYRCRRDAGCCQHEFQVCSATRSEKIEKTVLVAKVHSQDHRVHYQNLTMKTFSVDNDTACGCVEIVTPVEKPCPHPFVFDMESQKCKCRDVTFKKSCKRILRGEKELMPSDVRCIKEDKCRPLSMCSYGNFDMTKYQCPRKEDTHGYGDDKQRIDSEKKRHRG